MYEGTKVNKIIMQVLHEIHKSISETMSNYFPSPPDMEAIIYYTTHYVVSWAFYKIAISYTPKPSMQK